MSAVASRGVVKQPYRSANSAALIRYLIMHRPTIALRRRDDQHLIGWALIQYDYSNGMGFVLPEYRRRGLMMYIDRFLQREVKALGLEPFGYTISGNAAMNPCYRELTWS